MTTFIITYFPEIAVGCILTYLLYLVISFAIKLRHTAKKLDLEYKAILSKK